MKGRDALWVPSLVVLLALGVYLGTLSPSITWSHNGADSGDLAAAVATGGVPHPSGYPTYLAAAEVFRRLPWGDVGYRLGLLSAAASALAAGLIAATTLQVLPGEDGAPLRMAVAATAGLLFAFAPIPWSQAVIPEVYGLHALAFCAVFALTIVARESRRPTTIFLCFLALGLGLGNHLSIALFLPAVLVLTGRRLRSDFMGYVALAAVGLALGLSVYVLIPLRAAAMPPINWGDAATPTGFAWLVSGRVYRHLIFSLPVADLPARIVVALRAFVISGNALGLPLAVLGLIDCWTRDRRLAVVTVYGVVGFSVYAIGYNTIDSYVYLIPAIAVFVLWIGFGLGYVVHILQPYLSAARVPTVALMLVIVCFGLVGAPRRWSRLDLHGDTEALDYGVAAMHAAEPDALLIVSGDAHTFAVWYARYGLNVRQDVAVVNDSLLAYDWYRRTVEATQPQLGDVPSDADSLIAACLPVRPVELTDSPNNIPAGYRVVPAGFLFRVVPITADATPNTRPS